MPRLVDFWLVGEGCVAILGVQQFGRWFHLAFCGVFGGKKMKSFENRERTVVELKYFFLQYSLPLDNRFMLS
jgi:hypothetical protein